MGIAARRAGDIMQLAGLASWRGSQGFYNRDNLTYAASVAYYALLSLFPVFLLGMAIIGRVTADIETRDAVVSFVLRYFPTQFDFITDQLEAFRANQVTFGLTVQNGELVVGDNWTITTKTIMSLIFVTRAENFGRDSIYDPFLNPKPKPEPGMPAIC